MDYSIFEYTDRYIRLSMVMT